MITQTKFNQVMEALQSFQQRVSSFEAENGKNLSLVKSEFSSVLADLSRTMDDFIVDARSLSSETAGNISSATTVDGIPTSTTQQVSANTPSTTSLTETPSPATIEFKIKYNSTSKHPLSGKQMYTAVLIADDKPVFRAGPHYSKADMTDDLKLKVAEMNAARFGGTVTVSVNYGTELISVSADGTRTNVSDEAFEVIPEKSAAAAS